tara:strand:+ start:2799 stop:2924 length:126 start_codon:yes stop_codon:yes gene_type:complete
MAIQCEKKSLSSIKKNEYSDLKPVSFEDLDNFIVEKSISEE